MSRLLYYLLLRPLSLLPLPALYVLSDLLHFVLYRVFTYRKKVTLNNLRLALPERSEQERAQIASKYYHHLCDLVVESIRLFSISREEAYRRCKCRDLEVLDSLFEQGKSAIVVCGHYNNWELACVAGAPQLKHPIVGIYAPLSDEFFDRKFNSSRSRFGVEMVHKKQVTATFLKYRDRPTVVAFAADQSPSRHAKRHFWMEFLGQPTAVAFGTEKYAHEFDHPVVFMRIFKMKRGYYEFEFEVLEMEPRSTAHGDITMRFMQRIEAQIKERPEFWLWTHKRWKITPPPNVEMGTTTEYSEQAAS